MINKFKYYINFLIGFLFLILVTVSYFFVQYQLNIAIQNSSEAGNAVLTRVFVNETWSEISPLLPEPGADLEAIKSNPNINALDSKIRRFISYTDVAKVKLYNVKGMTLYSSETAQIGEDKSKNQGFQEAVRGNLASELIYRGHFGAFDKEIYNRNLVSTYAPIRDGYQVIAVAEIYSDRTSSIKVTNKLLNTFLLFLSASCLLLYIIILVIFKKFRNLNEKELNLISNSKTNVDSSPAEPIISLVDKSLLRFSSQYLRGINRFAHYVDMGTKYHRQGKIDQQDFLSEITELSSSVSTRLASNNLILSIENEEYIPTSQLIDLQLFIENLKLYISDETCLDVEKIQFYLSEDKGINLCHDENLLNLLFKVLFDSLSDLKFSGTLQIKIFNIDGTIEIMTVIDFGSAIPNDFHRLTDLFSHISNYLNQSAGMALDTRLSNHSVFIDLKLRSLALPLAISPQFKKIGLLLDSEPDVSLVKLMLEEIGIQFVVIAKSSNLEQDVKNAGIDLLMIDCGFLNSNSDLFDQLSHIISIGMLSKDQTLLIQPSYDEFQNSLNLPYITLPFTAESLYQKLNTLHV